MDTSQEKDVIPFHVKTQPFDPMVIFIVNKVAYKNGEFELSGTINDIKYIVHIKVQDGKTINVRLGEFEINESYDLSSGIAYSSFINTYAYQDTFCLLLTFAHLPQQSKPFSVFTFIPCCS